MSLEANTTIDVNHSERTIQDVESNVKSSSTPQFNSITPVKEEEHTQIERDETHKLIHLSPESEDERINSANVSLPLEEHVSYTPVVTKYEEPLQEDSKYEEEEKMEENKIKETGGCYPTKTERNIVREINDKVDDESDSEDAVLLIGCVKSANQAIELVRKCQRNYYKNHCNFDFLDGDDNDGGSNKNRSINNCIETTNKYANSSTHASMSLNNTKADKVRKTNKLECHDLPITLQEFAEQAQCSVSLFITRNAVFADALTGFTNEAQREQKEELRLRELYMEQLQWEQRKRMYEYEEEEQQSPRQHKASSIETTTSSNNYRERLHNAQVSESKSESANISKVNEADKVKRSEQISVMASESPINKGKTEEENLEVPSCSASSQLSAKQQYFFFMKDKLSQNKTTPYFLRHKYPVYERYSISASGPGINGDNKYQAMERRGTNRIVLDNDQVAHEWRFVWKQFKRDIAREVFIVQESVLNNADDAAVIVLSYLEYTFDRGSADAFVRHSVRMKSTNGPEANRSPNNSLSMQSSEPSTTTSSATWEETSPFTTTTTSGSNTNAPQTRIRNRDVWRSLLSAGSAAVKDALIHAQAALPEFVVEPIRDVITQIKNSNNNNNESFADSTSIGNSDSSNSMSHSCGTRSTLSRLREMWQARIENKEIKSIYPRSIKEKGRKVFAAAREVVLAGQQSFLAFPYMLLYEQIGMHALARATPLPSRNVTSSDEDEDEDEEDEDDDKERKVYIEQNEEKECGPSDTVASGNVKIKVKDQSNELYNKSEQSEESEQTRVCDNINQIANENNNNNSVNIKSQKDNNYVEKVEEGDDDDDDDEWSVLDDLEKLSVSEEVSSSKICDVAGTKNKKEKQHHKQKHAHRFKRNEPLMIGEPAVCDLHKFCEHIRQKIQRKDAMMSGNTNASKSLFREDVDGSVFLIPTCSSTESMSSSNKPEIHCIDCVTCEQRTEEQLQRQEQQQQEQAKPSHKRGTRIHLYYSPSRGVPVVCVSKLFRLYTLSQSTKTKTETSKAEETKPGANEINENVTDKNNASNNV